MRKYLILPCLFMFAQSYAINELPVKLLRDTSPMKRVVKKERTTKKTLPINQKNLSTFNNMHFVKENSSQSLPPQVLPISRYHMNVIHTPFTHPVVVADAPLAETKKDGYDIYFIPREDTPVHVYISDGLDPSQDKLSLLLVPKVNYPGADYNFNRTLTNKGKSPRRKQNRTDYIVAVMASLINDTDKESYQTIKNTDKVLGCHLSKSQSIKIKSQQRKFFNNKVITVTRLLNQSDYTQDLKMLICDPNHLLATAFIPGPRISPHGESTLYVLRDKSHKGLLR